MGAAYFYHMTRTPLEATLPMLLGKSLEAGWRVLVRAPDPERQRWLDDLLWQRPEDGFLPHGLAGDARAAHHPVLIAGPGAALGDRTALVSIDGAALSPVEVQAAERAMILFDGRSDSAVAHARTQWRALTEAGCGAQYWAQEDGGWVKKSEKTGA